ncbi:MAG TPA: hypothetical protein VHC39_20125 [Rhizomicrobium sp.]|nr:hypothetical protein [Rhizomicrobium sp.]
MRASGFSHGPFTSRDPVRAAEEDIRRYLMRHGVIAPPEPEIGEPQTALCLLAIYAAIAIVVLLGLFVLSRLECDPLFSDRGLTVACRNHLGALTRVGPASNGYPSFLPANLPQ